MAKPSCLLLFLGLGLCVPAIAQYTPAVPMIFVTVDPSGACGLNVPLRYNTSNGKLWGCDSGTWTQISGGGGGGSPAGPFGSFQYNSSGSFGGSPNLVFTQIAPPTTISASLAGAGAGNINNGTHDYACTNTDAYGETDVDGDGLGTPVFATVTVTDHTANGQVTGSCPTGPAGTTSRKVYRTVANNNFGPRFLLTIPGNVTTVFTDNIADSSLGALMPSVNTTGGAYAPNGTDATVAYGFAAGQAGFSVQYSMNFSDPALINDSLSPYFGESGPDMFIHIGAICCDAGGLSIYAAGDSSVLQQSLVANIWESGQNQLDYTHQAYLFNAFRGPAALPGTLNAHEVHTAWNVDYAIAGGAPGLVLFNESDPNADEGGGFPFGGMFLCGNYPHRTSTGTIVPECPAVLTAASAHSTDIGFAIVKGGYVAGNYTPQTADMMDLFDVDGTTLLPFHILPSGYVAQALHTPASSAEACTVGQWVDDASFHYVCTATNTWKRIVLVAF